MDTVTSNSLDRDLTIGDVFTPIHWSQFAIEKFSIYKDWVAGAKVFDPTMGEGNLLESLVLLGLEDGRSISSLPLNNLYGNELNANYFNTACSKFKNLFNVDMSANFTNADILKLPSSPFDIVFGNPPWVNFNNLPLDYKESIKKYFHEFDLIGNGRSLLLGGSRIDIASLIIQRSIRDFLRNDGRAVFFMPLSILLNDGANRHFRTYKVGTVPFQLNYVIDLQGTNAFDNVGTRYGIASFRKGEKTRFPIPYELSHDGNWFEKSAAPLFHSTDPLSVGLGSSEVFKKNYRAIRVPKTSQPRQGLNTCGANSVFFFKDVQALDGDNVMVDNEHILPKKYVHPLITSQNFKGEENPQKWVLIPHNRDGRPMDPDQIHSEPKLRDYLAAHEERLRSRKGSIIGSWIKRGLWWSLLGIGPYSFAPVKVVWEAYGKKEFNPQIFNSQWQANQSLQAFMPASTLDTAQTILAGLQQPAVQDYLLSLKMEGTMNWAQPGKIKKLLTYEEETLSLF